MKAFAILSLLVLLINVTAKAEIANAQNLVPQTFESAVERIQDLQTSESKTIEDTKHMTQLMTHGQKTKYVLLSIPGLHESPYHIQGLNKFFYENGANVLSLHLPGHQQIDKKAMGRVTAKQWEQAVADAITVAHGLGDQLLVLGYSTGGGLAVQAALQRPSEISQLFLFAPSIGLSNKTFLFALFGQLAGNKELCTKEKLESEKPGFFCNTFNKLDYQAVQMIKEGTYPSAAAGMQVQQIINDIITEFGNPEETNYYENLHEIYATLKVPTFMVSSKADAIVAPTLNHEVMQSLQVRKQLVEYPKNLKVTHLMITKSQGDALSKSPDDSFNPYFQDLLPKMKSFWMNEAP